MNCKSNAKIPIHSALRFLMSSILTSLMMISEAKSLSAADLIYVSLTDSSIVTYDVSSGNPATIVASKSTFVTGLGGYGLEFGGGDTLFRASGGTNSIDKISSTGTVTPFATGLNSPIDLAFDSTGYLYVSNFAAGTISKISVTGTVSTFATGLINPFGLAFDNSGFLYVANHTVGSISKISPTGTVSTFATGLSAPFDLTFDNSGYLYVSNESNGIVSRIDTSGVVTNYLTGLTYPRGLKFDEDGALYVADGGPNTISKFDSNGNFLFSFSTGAPAPLMFTFQPVPEPSSLVMTGLSAGLAGFLFRRKRRAVRIEHPTNSMHSGTE